MWDVKMIIACEKISAAPAFYLNYVGCKAIKLISSIALSNKFYLNYVGCKALPYGFDSDGDNCFTLTMWDVKENE